MKAFASFVTAGLLLAGPAMAQFQHIVTANVPFAFTAGNKHFPAGECIVKYSASAFAVLVQSREGHVASLQMTIPMESGDGPTDPQLVFHRYGDEFFLAEVWGGGGYRHRLYETRAEREIARKLGLPQNVLTGAIARSNR